MAWTIEYLPEAERDLELILDHLIESYRGFGDTFDEALLRARPRLSGLREAAQRLIATPFIGTLRPEIYPNLRFLRRNSAVFWFIADGEREKVLVVAIFFGPQDHTRRMLARLLGDLP